MTNSLQNCWMGACVVDWCTAENEIPHNLDYTWHGRQTLAEAFNQAQLIDNKQLENSYLQSHRSGDYIFRCRNFLLKAPERSHTAVWSWSFSLRKPRFAALIFRFRASSLQADIIDERNSKESQIPTILWWILWKTKFITYYSTYSMMDNTIIDSRIHVFILVTTIFVERSDESTYLYSEKYFFLFRELNNDDFILIWRWWMS